MIRIGQRIRPSNIKRLSKQHNQFQAALTDHLVNPPEKLISTASVRAYRSSLEGARRLGITFPGYKTPMEQIQKLLNATEFLKDYKSFSFEVIPISESERITSNKLALLNRGGSSEAFPVKIGNRYLLLTVEMKETPNLEKFLGRAQDAWNIQKTLLGNDPAIFQISMPGVPVEDSFRIVANYPALQKELLAQTDYKTAEDDSPLLNIRSRLKQRGITSPIVLHNDGAGYYNMPYQLTAAHRKLIEQVALERGLSSEDLLGQLESTGLIFFGGTGVGIQRRDGKAGEVSSSVNFTALGEQLFNELLPENTKRMFGAWDSNESIFEAAREVPIEELTAGGVTDPNDLTRLAKALNYITDGRIINTKQLVKQYLSGDENASELLKDISKTVGIAIALAARAKVKDLPFARVNLDLSKLEYFNGGDGNDFMAIISKQGFWKVFHEYPELRELAENSMRATMRALGAEENSVQILALGLPFEGGPNLAHLAKLAESEFQKLQSLTSGS